MAAGKRVKSGAAWALAVLAATSHAAEVRPVVVAGYDAGGDSLIGLTYTSGNTDSIRANEGLYAGAGVSVLNDAGNIEFQGTLSVKYMALHADNGGVTWLRYPLDALLFYRMRGFRMGGGLTYVIAPRLKGSGELSNIDTKLDNAAGAVLQADYLLERVNLGVRYTILDYKIGGNTIKSSGVGVSFGFAF